METTPFPPNQGAITHAQRYMQQWMTRHQETLAMYEETTGHAFPLNLWTPPADSLHRWSREMTRYIPDSNAWSHGDLLIDGMQFFTWCYLYVPCWEMLHDYRELFDARFPIKETINLNLRDGQFINWFSGLASGELMLVSLVYQGKY